MNAMMENPGNWRHLCVDMQRVFAEATPWQVTWMDKVLPAVAEVVGRHTERTIFTRFITPDNPEQMPGTWRAYYRKWQDMTLAKLPPEMTTLVPELARFVPPARVFDKMTYSPWINGKLDAHLRSNVVETIVISGGETDVCVLAAVLGAIDLGYRTIVLTDAVCGSADETHDASLKLLGDRFSAQLELMPTEVFLASS
jgi:nicotinamidase-related amidase